MLQEYIVFQSWFISCIHLIASRIKWVTDFINCDVYILDYKEPEISLWGTPLPIDLNCMLSFSKPYELNIAIRTLCNMVWSALQSSKIKSHCTSMSVSVDTTDSVNNIINDPVEELCPGRLKIR